MHYLIDGYNLFFFLPEIKGSSFQKKREQIIAVFEQYLSIVPLRISLVFDGNKQGSGLVERTHLNQLELVYTAKNQTADMYIIQELESHLKPQNVTVVTSDQGLLRQCQSLHAQTQTLEEFLEFLSQKKQKLIKKRMQEKPLEEPKESRDKLEVIFEKRLNRKKRD